MNQFELNSLHAISFLKLLDFLLLVNYYEEALVWKLESRGFELWERINLISIQTKHGHWRKSVSPCFFFLNHELALAFEIP